MPYTQIANQRIYYEAPRGHSGQPVLFVHGAAGSSRLWLPLLEKLPPEIAPFVPDLPGHGRSEGYVSGSVAEAARFLDAFADACYLGEALPVVGHSLGGLVTLQLAVLFPRRAARLALLATAARVQLHPDFLAQAISGHWDHAQLRLAFGDQVAPAAVQPVLAACAETRLSPQAEDYMDTRTADLGSDLARLTLSTLVIVGTDDVILSPRKTSALAGALPDSRLVRLVGAGHYLHLEQPAAVAEALAPFLALPTLGELRCSTAAPFSSPLPPRPSS